MQSEEDRRPQSIQNQLQGENAESYFDLPSVDAHVPYEKSRYAHRHVEDRPDHAKGPVGKGKRWSRQLSIPARKRIPRGKRSEKARKETHGYRTN